MKTATSSWHASTAQWGTTLRCAACRATVDLEAPQLDHHPRVCPACGVACAFLNWKNRTVQVVPENAPPGIRLALRFLQEQFDELDYAEFVVALQELMDDLYSNS